MKNCIIFESNKSCEYSAEEFLWALSRKEPMNETV